MTNTQRVKLDHPFEVDGETVEAVSLRRPKVRDLRKMEAARSGGDMEQSVVLMAALTDLPVSVIEEIDSDDFMKLSKMIEGFFPKAGERGGR